MTTEPMSQPLPPFDRFDSIVYRYSSDTRRMDICARLVAGSKNYDLDADELSNAYVTAVLSVPDSSHHQALSKALRAMMAERMENELRNGQDGGHAAFTITNHFLAIADTTAQVVVAQEKETGLIDGAELIGLITEMEQRPLEQFISRYEGMENIDEGEADRPDYRFQFRLLNNELISLSAAQLAQRHKKTSLFLDLNADDDDLPEGSLAAHAVVNSTHELDELEKAQDDLALRQPDMRPDLKAPSYIKEYMCGYYDADEGDHAIGAVFLDEDEDQLALTFEQMQARLRLGLETLNNGDTQSPEDSVKLRREMQCLEQAFRGLGFMEMQSAAPPVRDMSSVEVLREVAEYYQLLDVACDIAENGQKNYTATLQIGPRPEQTEILTQSQIELELERIPHQLAQEDQPLLRHRYAILVVAIADLHTLRAEQSEPLSIPDDELAGLQIIVEDDDYPTLVDTLLLDNLDEQKIAKAKPTTCFIELARGKGEHAGQMVARLTTAFGHVVELDRHEVQARLDAHAEMVDLAERHFIETYHPLYNTQLAIMEEEHVQLQHAASELAMDRHYMELMSEIDDEQTQVLLYTNKASAHLTKDIAVKLPDLPPEVHQAFSMAGRLLQQVAQPERQIKLQPPRNGLG